MFFGNEHLGRAVAFHRESQDLKQHELAARIGLKSGTLNQYESGRRGMSEEMVKKIARALELDPLEIWDTAYRIFRYNGFRERADEEGIAVEELIARVQTGPSVEQILELYDSWAERDRQGRELTLRLLESRKKAGLDGSNLLNVIVKSPPKKLSQSKAVRLGSERGKTSKSS